MTRAGLRGTANGRLSANALFAYLGQTGPTITKMTRQRSGRPDYGAMADILTRIAAELRQRSPPSDDDQNRRQAERLERIVAEIRAYLEE
ncbi:MAG: hypothetical protein SFV19_12280 [Rhodospirillaceae bacterium]|nr:hypothetical protein [Rhodospirillaceae bacterium]